MYIKVADAIEEAFPSVVVEGNEAGDGRPGSFEVSTPDGASSPVLFSKLDTKQVPDVEDVISRIVNRNRGPGAQ
ncbi:hypothetical protein DUNSADRAFT_12669 [Dunaliella salina]|uniref:Selenoprotein W-related protein n=1 Tax=Dunaliella salina TaxID=3046 RepID=A0ABQ7H3R5_DUNSA|nr:hypothetical protein DUNSADRAFT_12669 [Dunaliella salina]|eukprot:KAF5841502.1 hypothetical protein DUNSADRAFT_12669 [Dunaliella salina]